MLDVLNWPYVVYYKILKSWLFQLFLFRYSACSANTANLS